MYCTALQQGLDRGAIERHQNWIARLQEDVRQKQLTETARVKDVAAQVTVAQLALRDVRMLERLYETAKRRHEAAVKLAESKEMDEFAASRAQRAALGG